MSFTLKTLINSVVKLTVISTILLVSHNTSAQAECKNLSVAFAENWFPVSFLDTSRDRKMRGVAVDIIQAIADERKVQLSFVNPISWEKANNKMDKGEIDIIAGHFWSEARNDKWHISGPLFSSDIRVFYLGDNFEINHVNDLIGLKGMRPAAASYGDELDSFIANELSVSDMRNNTTMVLSLYKQQSDYAIIERLDGLGHIFRLGLQEKIAISEFSLSELKVHFSFSKRSPCASLFADFNKSAARYISDSQIKAMTNRASSHYFHMPL